MDCAYSQAAAKDRRSIGNDGARGAAFHVASTAAATTATIATAVRAR